MTETLMPPAPVLPAPVVEESARGKAKLFVALGLVGALALGGGGYLLLSGGGEETFVVPSARKATTAKVTKPAAKPVAKKKPQTVPVASSAVLGRDPFKPLYVQPAEPVAPVAAAPGTPTTTQPTTTVPGTTTPATASYSLKLVSIAGTGQNAKVYTFLVAGTTKRVIAAQRFGKYGELVVLAWTKTSSGRVTGAVIQVGDDNPVAVKIGETVSVK